MAKKKKQRLGRVCVETGYVVDLDNPDMVQEAKDCLYEDIMNAVKYDEVSAWIHIIPDPNASAGDIPEFLLPEGE